MPAPPNGQRPVSALIEEKFHPGVVNVISPPGMGVLLVQMLVGEISPPQSPVGVYVAAKLCELDADTAIALGEHLIREGRRAKTGLEIPAPAILRP